MRIPTGNKLIIWGGQGESANYFNDGAIYDLSKNSLVEMAASPLKERLNPSSLLIDDKLIVWGGFSVGKRLNDGAIYELPVVWD